jgi:hypothetical protein
MANEREQNYRQHSAFESTHHLNDEGFLVYLHCAGAPAGRPNAVVTAILQPSGVFTNTRSDTPLDVVSFWVTV